MGKARLESGRETSRHLPGVHENEGELPHLWRSHQIEKRWITDLLVTDGDLGKQSRVQNPNNGKELCACKRAMESKYKREASVKSIGTLSGCQLNTPHPQEQ